MRINDVEVFAVGTWNGQEFGRDDLDVMVVSFDELGLAGKLPVKLGHDMRDTEPAQGWVTALRREGDKLLATFDHVADDLVEAIKQGRWRHVSVELLGNVSRGDKKYRWVLDAVAVLGAARPAVDSLRGLHELVASRSLQGWQFGSRVSFSRNLEGFGMSEVERLKSENAKLTRDLINAKFTTAIQAGLIIPADQTKFERRFGAAATVADAQNWIDDFSNRQNMSRTDGRLQSRAGGGAAAVSLESMRPDEAICHLANELIEQHRVKFARDSGYQPLSFMKAAEQVLRDPQHAELARRHKRMCSEDLL